MHPHILLTLGDPRGIGPEVTAGALDRLAAAGSGVRISIVGPDWTHEWDGSDFLDLVPGPSTRDEDAGSFAARSIERATASALAGEIQAIVTAPLHKPSLRAAGWNVPGQTEMLQALTGADEVGMLMAAERTRLGGSLRILLATTHIGLRDVPRAVTSSLLVRQSLLLHEALRTDWRIDAPRIALCALNPHASDDGLFGDEEARVFGPAIEELSDGGVHVTGPLSADTVFHGALAGRCDAVVAPYHDVGMAAFKTVAFGAGVNVTLGLPFVRTSPDHGTAFDIAGQGRADPSSMLEAIRLACRLACARFDTDSADV